MNKKIIIGLLGLLLLVTPMHLLHAQADTPSERKAVIYYNEACSSCNMYLENDLTEALNSNGITEIELKDYINKKSNRADYNTANETLNIPFELREHMETIVDGRIVFSGHVPANLITEALEANQTFNTLVLYEKEMHGTFTEYKVWGGKGPIMTYSIDTPLQEYLDYYSANKDSFTENIKGSNDRFLLPLVLWSGLIDGINPCAIAVLIFFMAFLFSLRATLGKILKYGFTYIFVIYLTYLSIGLGLLKAVAISDTPHLMAQIGAWLVIALGIVNLIGYYMPSFPIKMGIPKFSQKTLKSWLTKATFPSVIVGAFLVGLCTFPCSGGIYVAIIALLTAQHTYVEGFIYLLIYNVMFVVPLIVLLGLAGNKVTLGKVAQLHKTADKKLKLWGGIIMIALGIIILLWFI